MAKKCPKCKRNSLDYDPVYKAWRCIWVDCSFQEKNGENEKRPLLTSIFGTNLYK